MKINLKSHVCKMALSIAMAVFATSPVCAAEAAVKELSTALDKISTAQAQAEKNPKAAAGPECVDPTELNRAIQDGNAAKQSLTDELTRYKNLQLVLTSGLVAALLTAIGAVTTLVVTSRNSKPERDLKRLEVAEKGAQMRRSGIAVPSDIEKEYLVAAASINQESQ